MAADSETSHPFCGFCGNQNLPSHKFCTGCGKPLENIFEVDSELSSSESKKVVEREERERRKDELDDFWKEVNEFSDSNPKEPIQFQQNDSSHKEEVVKNMPSLGIQEESDSPKAEENTRPIIKKKTAPNLLSFLMVAKGTIILLIILSIIIYWMISTYYGKGVFYPNFRKYLGDDLANKLSQELFMQKVNKGIGYSGVGIIIGFFWGLIDYWKIGISFSSRLMWSILGSIYLAIAWGIAGITFGFGFGGGFIDFLIAGGLGGWLAFSAYYVRNEVTAGSRDSVQDNGKSGELKFAKKSNGISSLASTAKTIILFMIFVLLAYSNWQLIFSGDVFDLHPFSIPFKVIGNMFTALTEILSLIFGG